MSLFDNITPSERAVELGLMANRVRRRMRLDVVPMLVVEGATDEEFFSGLCSQGAEQIFPAGTRALVEQLFAHLKREPVEGCECVFLVDCDGRGKTVNLATERELLVTETCDLEADVVRMGVAARVARRFVDSDDAATGLVRRACELAMVVSVVRRAAHSASVSMKIKGGRQLRFEDLPEIQLSAWEADLPSEVDVLNVVGSELTWSTEEVMKVLDCIGGVQREFATTCLGKDALDALFRLLRSEGNGDVRGWSREHFHKVVFRAVGPEDLDQWEVGRRLQAWQNATGHVLLA